ncbi:Xaa-Pro aminopeptidase 1 [Nosema granulosis]|uniref:Xaa-Pro aminopeptidase 1 n=1 Tax=Nosema granulosis TaxID=83296 RepID=A0A9P6H2D7_9MICR|nr:Xaa-Pro aminopeptidase 1 [Nosema granulosis]
MNLDVYLVPVGDEHFNENLTPSEERVKMLTGFTGTYGMAVVGKTNAFFTSYQFTEIAAQELKGFELMIETRGADLPTHLQSKGVKTAGINPRLITSKQYIELFNLLKAKGIQLIPYEEDLIEKVWTARPKREFKKIISIENRKMEEFVSQDFIKQFKEFAIGPPRVLGDRSEDDGPKSYDLDVQVNGESYKDRIKRIQSKIKSDEGLVVSSLDSIGWLLNLRGHDIDYSASFYSFVYMTRDNVKLFVGAPVDIKGVEVMKYNDFYDFIAEVKEEKVLVSGDVNYEIYRRLKNPEYSDILLNEEVLKNNVELFGYKNAAIKDGTAMIQLFSWIEKNIDNRLTEIDIRTKMYELKAKEKGYVSESFEPLVASGPNSARIYHKASKRVLKRDEILLVDTGSHYFHGTTDLTRTVVFGTPTKDMIKYYTIVLQSLIDGKYIAKSKITGKEIDDKLRKHLRAIGRDFPTSSGHGVGYFGQVHEKLPKINYDNDVLYTFNSYTLEPTYFDANMGIRIEDQVFNNRKGKLFYQTNLTYTPLDLKMVDPNELTDEQLNFVNGYSAKLREFLTPILKNKKDAFDYLMRNTEKLTKTSNSLLENPKT